MHYTVNWFCTFSNTTSFPLLLVWVKSVSWNRACEFTLHACVCVLNFIYATFYPLIFYAKFLLACSTCLLCTTFVFTSFFSIILRPIICSYETKLNFFLLYYSVFVYIRLEDCCCCLVFLFSLQRAMCTADVIWLREWVFLCVLVSSRAYFDARRGCLRVWVSEVA